MDLCKHLIFEDDLEKEWYEKICKLPIIPGKYARDPTLDTLNIRIGILKLIYAIDWANFFVADVPTFVELAMEFYTTFQFYKPAKFNLHTLNLISYYL